MIRSNLLARLQRASLTFAGCLALGALAASCDGSSVCGPSTTSTLISERLTSGKIDKLDIVLDIDNSRSMADKQQILALAVPDLVRAVANPPCVDDQGNVTPASGPLDKCPGGTKRKAEPLLDIHIGVISSSLGGHGSDACSTAGAGKQSNNDKGHLIARMDPSTPAEIETYQNLKFLAWDPAQKLNPPGEADVESDSGADANSKALVPSLRDMVLGVGEVGCGYEAQLESWYRFLVDPSPVEEVALDSSGKIILKGTDKVLLDQRKAFLRPDSLLAIIMLTDENDCSMRESGQFYFAAQQKASNGDPFRLPKARAICDQNPNDQCCFSCGQTGPKDDNGDVLCDADPSCKTADGKTAYLDEVSDNINLRCLDQKRRFGIDFLYETDRYVDALRSTTVTDRNGQVVSNPIFSDLDFTDANSGSRTSGMVFLLGIVGVPWQDIARTDKNGVPDLRTGLDSSGAPVGGFKNADELVAALPGKAYSAWDLILGQLENYPAADALPKDPLMIESINPRSGNNPITGDALVTSAEPLGNEINGHERAIPARDDLQYACIFPLAKLDNATGDIVPDKHDCSMPDAAACDCGDDANDNPLCALNPATMKPTDQVRGKAYPSLRELKVLRDIGSQGVVASVCPAQVIDYLAPDFGYRQAVNALFDRLVSTADGSCLQRTLETDADGRVACLIIEATRVDAGKLSSCNACSEDGRDPVSADHKGAEEAIKEGNPSGQFNCFCEIPQLTGKNKGEPLWACQNDPASPPVPDSGSADGFCYIDETNGIGNPEIVEGCPATQKRILRFAGKGEAKNGATLFITCYDEKVNESAPSCE